MKRSIDRFETVSWEEIVVKKRNLGIMAFILSTAMLASACGSGNEDSPASGQASPASASTSDSVSKPSYTFKLGHEVQVTHIKNLVATKFGEELAKESEGRMKVEIYPAAQLGKEPEMVQQVQTGTLDFAIISDGYMASQSESLNGWFMPFLFPDLKAAAEARKSDAAQQMLKDLEALKIVGLDYLFAGNRHLLLQSGTFDSLDDVKGKKIRVPSSAIFSEFWKALGAGPVPMALPEVYMSLQTGVIDGVDTDIDALLTQKFYENAKYLTLTNHVTFPEVVIASKSVFDKLSAEDQQIIKNSMSVAIDWGIEQAIEAEQSKLDELKKLGVTVADVQNKNALIQATQSIYQEYSDKNAVIKAFIEQNRK